MCNENDPCLNAHKQMENGVAPKKPGICILTRRLTNDLVRGDQEYLGFVSLKDFV
jgi:hypothetical protein